MSVALTMLRASLNEGLYCDNVQFDTVRKTKAWISNVFNSSADYDGPPCDGGEEAFVSVSRRIRNGFITSYEG